MTARQHRNARAGTGTAVRRAGDGQPAWPSSAREPMFCVTAVRGGLSLAKVMRLARLQL
jgi:hypothetical protein